MILQSGGRGEKLTEGGLERTAENTRLYREVRANGKLVIPKKMSRRRTKQARRGKKRGKEGALTN